MSTNPNPTQAPVADPPDQPKAVRFRVKEILQERGMSIKELVELSGLHDGTIRLIVKNYTERIDKTTLSKICHALDVGIADVLVLKSADQNQ